MGAPKEFGRFKMAARVRTCLEAFNPRGCGVRPRFALLACLLSALLSCVAVATAVANCSISTYGSTGSLGGGNAAEPDIPRCEVAHPINCATGNLTETQVDLAVNGHGPPLQLTRYYNSQLAYLQLSAGSFGYGWTSSYSAHLTFESENTVVTVHHDNASTINFALEAGVYNSPVWTQATLVKSGSNYVYTQPDFTKLEFNSSGRLLKITDRHNLDLTLAYNGSGRLETVTDEASRKLTFTYNAGGQVEKVTDPMGRVAKYAYSSGNLANVTLPGMETPRWKFGYNGLREMTTLTNGRGFTTTTTYDAAHRATTQTDPMGRKYTLLYKETNGVRETTVTDPNGAVSLKKFNEAGAPTSITRGVGTPLEATTKYTYNSQFLVISETDPLSHTTTYTYDSRGNKLTEIDPNGNETKWTYDETNDVETVTNPKGQVTTITRNATGDPILIERQIGASTQEMQFAYNEWGDLTQRTDPAGRVRIFLYFLNNGQPLGEYVSSISTENLVHRWAYNVNGEVTEEVDGRGFESGNTQAQFTTKITRDAQGRPTITTDPLGNTTKLAYDLNGNVESVTDGKGNVTSYVYDSVDQRTEVKFPIGATVKSTYNPLGQIATRANGNGHTTEYKRDLFGRLVEGVDPLGRKTSYEYDLAGRLVKKTDSESRSTTYSYDAGGRRTKIDYSSAGTADVSFVYDKNGNVTEMTDGTGTTKRVYDDLDRPTEIVNGKSEVVKYEYNLAGDVTKLTYPNGKAITRGFDTFGRLNKIVDWFGKETKFGYYRNSQLKATTFPTETGNVDEYVYDARGAVAQIAIKKGAESLASFSYTRDKNGNIEKIVQKGFPGPEEILYGYDAASRLTKSNSTEFAYDAGNNLTKNGSAQYTYDKGSQIASASTGTFAYSKFGQRTKSTPPSEPATSYVYDQAGNLTSVQRPAEGETTAIDNTFKYDGNGLRTTETNGASTYPMAWDTIAELPLLLRKGNDFYIYGPEGLPIAQIISSSTHYFHHDHQGSTRLLTSSTGSVIGTYEYSAYGDLASFTGPQSTQIGFAGQYRSHTSRLIYMRARTYDAKTAQFLSIDPMVDKTNEPYGYAQGNPVNLSDPTGLTVYGACGSLSINLVVAGASGTGCITIDGSGNIGVVGYGKGLKLWGSAQEWGEGLKSYYDGFKDLIGLDSSAGAWKALSKSFGRFFDGELGLLWSNADSVEALNGKFNSITDSLTLGFWHANSMEFSNDKGIYGYVNTAGKNSMPWIGMQRNPCEEIDFYGHGFDF